jgi:threonine/homoserine/homoserine lactone efflux protein
VNLQRRVPEPAPANDRVGARVVFVHLVPLGLALAFSTVPILAAFVIVLSPARSRSAIPYLIGLICGIFVLAGLAALAAQFVPPSPHLMRRNGVVGIVEIVLGVLLIAVGAYTFFRGRKRAAAAVTASAEPPEPVDPAGPAELSAVHAGPAWLRSVEKLGPRSSFGVALLLNIRPKALLLAIAAGLALHADAGSPTNAVLALAVYTVIGASTVAIPIIAAVAAPDRVERPLSATREWLVSHGNLITIAILVLVGIVVIVLGVQRL